MKTSLISASLLVLVSLYSCQKEIDINLGDPPSGDSAWFVSSIHRLDYDSNGVLNDSSIDYITYQQDKTLYKHVSNYYGPIDSFQYTYYYDQNKRVTKFDLDYNTDPVDEDIKTILFTYTGSNAARTDITSWNGDVVHENIAYSSGSKIITLYDTVPSTYQKEMIMTYYLGAENRIDSVREIWKMSVAPFYIDTTSIRLAYDAQNNATRLHDNTFIQHFDPLGGGYVIDGFDSIIVQSRETRGGEVAATWTKILSNMSWYPFLVLGSPYNMGMLDNPITFSKYPLISAKRWTRMFAYTSPDPSFYNGTFINTFNSNNLLVQQQIPEGFANKWGGSASLTFTYVKLPK